jgi:hypothetical protein
LKHYALNERLGHAEQVASTGISLNHFVTRITGFFIGVQASKQSALDLSDLDRFSTGRIVIGNLM